MTYEADSKYKTKTNKTVHKREEVERERDRERQREAWELIGSFLIKNVIHFLSIWGSMYCCDQSNQIVRFIVLHLGTWWTSEEFFIFYTYELATNTNCDPIYCLRQ